MIYIFLKCFINDNKAKTEFSCFLFSLNFLLYLCLNKAKNKIKLIYKMYLFLLFSSMNSYHSSYLHFSDFFSRYILVILNDFKFCLSFTVVCSYYCYVFLLLSNCKLNVFSNTREATNLNTT